MSTVALLQSIRHQMRDMHEAMRSQVESKTWIKGSEPDHWVRSDSEFVVSEYEKTDDPYRYEGKLLSVKYWPALQPLEAMIRRVDLYIEQASKHP